jgi:glucose/mannose transport system permease protein
MITKEISCPLKHILKAAYFYFTQILHIVFRNPMLSRVKDLFRPRTTGINLFLENFGIEPKWYTDTNILAGFEWGKIEFGLPVAIIAVVIAAVWQMTGFALAMYLAGLRGIPDDIREAARMDGCTEFQLYRKIIIPLLKPITVSVIIMMAHISLKIFDLIYAMTGPGANFVTDVPGVNMFETTFRGNYYANGAAIAIIMLLSVAIFIVPYLWSNRKGES